jgi:hypothetical protein
MYGLNADGVINIVTVIVLHTGISEIYSWIPNFSVILGKLKQLAILISCKEII